MDTSAAGKAAADSARNSRRATVSHRIALLGACLLGAGTLALSACKPSAAPDAGNASPAATTAEPAVPASDTPGAAQPDAGAAATGDDAGPTMPTLALNTVDGKAYDLAEHRGKWVVINFWATWCAPCRKEMPELSALDAMRETIEVIGLAYEDITPADMSAFLQKHPVVYPVAILDTMAPPADFAAPQGLPMTYLIAPDGTVAKRFLGPITAKEIEDAIASAKTKAA